MECLPCVASMSNVSQLKLFPALWKHCEFQCIFKTMTDAFWVWSATAAHLLHRRTRDDLKVFSAVFLQKQSVKSLEYLLDVILWEKGILLLSAGGKLILHFHLAEVPSLSCFHVNRSILFLSHSASLSVALWWTAHREHKDSSIRDESTENF